MIARFRTQKFTPLVGASLCMWVACAAVPGCAVRDMAMPEPAAKRVSLADFSQPASAPSAQPTPKAEPHDDVPLAAASDSDAAAPASSAGTPAPAAHEASTTRRLRSGEVFIVDSLVGQINGRPIYADAFFAPIENQLVEERRRLGDVAFRDRAWSIILTHLRTLIEDELFLAEAQASLRPEERQGLFNFMRYIRERTIAMGGGTQTGAQQRLQETGEGETIDQYVRGRLDEELIRKLLQDKIMPRVIVSWRDVEREFRRRESEFNPPPTLHLSRIRISNDEPEKIEQVKSMLAAGEPFETIAESVGQGDGVWQTFTVGEEGLHDIQISDALKPYLQGLEVGQTTEPIPLSNATMWLHLAKFDQTQRSLYELDVQRGLMRQLHNERFRAEQTRYLESLLQKRVHDDLTLMARRLLEVALQRYGGAAAASESPAS